jgi:pilus assembly protein CpaD
MTRQLSLAAASAIATVALAGCGHDGGRADLGYTPLTPTEQYTIEVRQRPDQIQLAPNPGGLSRAQEAAVADLAERWRDAGGGLITIQAPNGIDSGATSEAARALLVTLGAAPDEVRIVGYGAPSGARPAVIVGYAAYEAAGPQCGTEWENLAADHLNKPHRNFGCSVTANIATQIANPRDLIAPRTMGPADAARRSVVLDKYRKGETTSTAKDEQATGTLSTAAGNNQ